MATRNQIRAAKNAGINRPRMVARQAAKAKVPFYVACAFLMQETSGGQNVFGHDVNEDGTPRPFWGAGEVTQEKYACYLMERDLYLREPTKFGRLGPRRQGIGWFQLTWHTYQDLADTNGGCWNPTANTYTALTILRGHYDTVMRDLAGTKISEIRKWTRVAKMWSGKTTYSEELRKEFPVWLDLVGE